MKWWYWLILELLIFFGVGIVAYFTDCDILATGIIGASLFCLIEKIRKIITSEGVQMNEEYFEQIKNLCKACGLAIDKIARKFNIKQDLIAKLFMETMQSVLSEVGNEIKRTS